ncbi:MAG: methyltransferase domain-containing protein [Candidatus Eremiobacteraeota bacterium]|nr:methyltransferase domain-containing protein [Candidatus Eremiobacteraeota bacterium]
MDFTGERFVPALKGQIYYEHLHRYALAARFCAGKRVLDVASGEGYGSALLARHAADVVGVDVDEDAVDHARRTYYAANLRFLRGSVTEVPLADASVDVITSFETIEHVAEHEKMLDELQRVLAPNGVLVISSPNKLVYSDMPGFHNPYHVRELYFAELRDMLARRFAHVALYGQRVSASSVVHPLAGEVSLEATWLNGSADHVGEGLPALPNPVYFVAVCSDAPVEIDLSSSYVDAGDDLLEDIWVELNELRRRVVLELHGGERAALPPPSLPSLEAHTFEHPPVFAQPDGLTEEDWAERERELTAEFQEEIFKLEEQLGTVTARERTAYDNQLARQRAEHEAEIESVRAADAAQAARVLAAVQERLSNEIEAGRRVSLELDESLAELERAREAYGSAMAALYEERARNERLMRQIVALRDEHAEDAEGAAAALEAARHECAVADRTATALRDELAALAQRVRVADEDVARLTELLRGAEGDSLALREVLSSHSWKLTAPLRRALSAVRR